MLQNPYQPYKDPHGFVYNNQDKAETFAEIMEQQFKLNNFPNNDLHWNHMGRKQGHQINYEEPEIKLRRTGPNEVKKNAIRSIGNRKAAGPDIISPSALKNLSHKQITEIVNITNSILPLQSAHASLSIENGPHRLNKEKRKRPHYTPKLASHAPNILH